MIVNQNKIEKGHVTISELTINLKNNNIYLIDGENGSGKTTLMESMVFDTLDVDFESEEEKYLYNSKRGRLFAYFSQNIIEFSGTVYEFLKKDIAGLSKKDAENFLKDYRCDNIRIDDEFLSLSGGERTKVALISVLSKDAKYIFLDEPTNNLDKDSIEWFVNVLKNIKNKCIVLISHDKYIREIANEIIDFKSDFNVENLKKDKKKTVFRKDSDSKKATAHIFKSKYNIMYVLLLIIATIILGNIVSILEKSIYTKENLPSEDNILIYIMDETYEELNQNYVSGRNLKVDSNDYERIFPLSEIKELAKKSEIKNIYIRDESVYDKYYSVNEEENSDEKFIFSIPEVMYYNDTFINWMSIKEITYLKEGRLPNDNEFEIVVSEKILEEYDVERENAIGKNIQLDNVLYEIVGIGIEDVYLVSYEKGINRGIYCYNGNTFDEYYNKTKKYYNDMLYKGYLYDAIFIETEKGSEKEVLKELICNYPASNYYSHDFAYILNRGFNKTFYIAITVTTIVCSALYGASLSMILGGHLRNSVNKVNDYVNYYIDINIRNMYMRKYKYFIVMNYLINILVGIFYIRKKDIESIASVAIYLFIFIVQIPSVLVLMKNSNKLMERNINDC